MKLRSVTPSIPATPSLYPHSGLRAKTGRISSTMPKPGKARMYTSGWPKNQKRFWYRYWLPPALARKKDVFAVRSMSTIAIVATSTGAASTIRIEVDSTPQTKIGRRDQLIPGARIVKIVASRLIPTSVSEIAIRMNAIT